MNSKSKLNIWIFYPKYSKEYVLYTDKKNNTSYLNINISNKIII